MPIPTSSLSKEREKQIRGLVDGHAFEGVVEELLAEIERLREERDTCAFFAQDVLAGKCTKHVARAESTCEACDHQFDMQALRARLKSAELVTEAAEGVVCDVPTAIEEFHRKPWTRVHGVMRDREDAAVPSEVMIIDRVVEKLDAALAAHRKTR